jgi:hypothetical protein
MDAKRRRIEDPTESVNPTSAQKLTDAQKLCILRDELTVWKTCSFSQKYLQGRLVRVTFEKNKSRLLLLLGGIVSDESSNLNPPSKPVGDISYKIKTYNFFTKETKNYLISSFSNTPASKDELEELITASEKPGHVASLLTSSHLTRKALEWDRILQDQRRGKALCVYVPIPTKVPNTTASVLHAWFLWGTQRAVLRTGQVVKNPCNVAQKHSVVVIFRSWFAQDVPIPTSLLKNESMDAFRSSVVASHEPIDEDEEEENESAKKEMDAPSTLSMSEYPSVVDSIHEGSTDLAHTNQPSSSTVSSTASPASSTSTDPLEKAVSDSVPPTWEVIVSGGDGKEDSFGRRGIDANGFGFGPNRISERVLGEYQYLLLHKLPSSDSSPSSLGFLSPFKMAAEEAYDEYQPDLTLLRCVRKSTKTLR